MQIREPATSPARSSLRWALATVLTVLVAALLLLLHDPRYFFRGDTQAAYLGWEYHLGEQIRGGHWPLLDPSAWGAANPAAEGQWGLFSPLVIALGLVATVSSNVLVFATAVKVAVVCAGSLGAYLLARSYGAVAPLAFVAAVAVSQGGMTQYLDLPSWLSGLMIWSLLPWVWWALRRTMFGGAGPALPLVLGYLLVTVGYVYGTMMLIVVLVACLLDAWAAGSRSAAWKVLGVGVVCGLVALTVYLPGVLTAPVTIRGTGFAMSGKFASDPLALFTSVLPTATVPGTTQHLLPYAYTLWFLPVLAWLDFARLRRHWRPVGGLLLMAVVMALVVVGGPARIGPLHWPLRLQPFLVQSLGVLCAVLVSRYAVRRPSAPRLLVSVAWVVVAAVAASVRAHGGWTENLVSMVLVAAGVCGLWWALTHRERAAVATSAVLGAAAFTVGLAAVQHGFFSVLPSAERHMPAQARDYLRPLSAARGDVMAVGRTSAALQLDPAMARDVLTGSAWYLGRHRVANTYTTISFKAYKARYCTEFDGSTCPELLDRLFSTEPHTGRRRVDLLATSTLVLVRRDFPHRSLQAAPAGWRVAATTPRTVTWVRTRPVPGAGRPVWTSPGTSVSLVSADARSARFAVRRVPSGGGQVVLSTLAWPGYRTDVGRLGDPVDGYLLRVDLPGDAVGRTVDVRFSPPGWPVEVAAWWLAVSAGLVWCVLDGVRRRRRGAAVSEPGRPRRRR